MYLLFYPARRVDISKNIDNGRNVGTSEIVQVDSTPREADTTTPEVAVGGASQSKQRSQEQNHCKSLMRSKVSPAHVIQQAEGGANHSSWTKRKVVSIAEKLELKNLRLEPCFVGMHLKQLAESLVLLMESSLLIMGLTLVQPHLYPATLLEQD